MSEQTLEKIKFLSFMLFLFVLLVTVLAFLPGNNGLTMAILIPLIIGFVFIDKLANLLSRFLNTVKKTEWKRK